MKILYVNDFYSGGGAEHAMHDIANAALSAGHDVSFATLSKVSELNHFTLSAIRGAIPFLLFRRTIFFNSDPLASGRFKKILQKIKPDIVHCHNLYQISPGIINYIIEKNIPCIVTFHDFWPMCMNRAMVKPGLNPCTERDWTNCTFKCKHRKVGFVLKPFVNRGFQKRGRLLLQDGVTLVALSNFIKKTLTRFGYPEDRIEVIPNGIDTSYFTPPSKKGERNTVLFVGRGVESKGILDFVKIAEQYQKKYGNELDFMVIGARIDSKNVESLGWIPRNELVTYYRSALALLELQYVPPGIGLAPLEAMACSTPVVAYAVPGVDEYLTNGTDAYCIQPGDLEATVDRLAFLKRNPRTSLQIGKKAREKTERFFSLQETTKRCLQLYSDAATRKSYLNSAQ